MKRFLAVCLVLAACSAGLTQVERDELLMHAKTLEECRAVGRDAGNYAAYDQCKKEAGIR